MSDRLHDTLSALRTDVDSMPLADSSAVRARGTQRTRRQAVGTTLAVAALVAGAVGIGGALTGNNNADNLPAPAPTVSTSQTPSPDPTVETRPAIDTSVLLAADDMPPVPNQTFAVGETLDPATSADAEERYLTVCLSPPSGAQTPDLALLRTFPSDLDAFMWQWVAQYPTAGDAETAFGALTNACSAEPGRTVTPLKLPTEASGIRATKFSADPGSEYNGGITGVVRQGDVVLVVGLRGMLRDGDVDLDAFDAAVVRAAERVTSN